MTLNLSLVLLPLLLWDCSSARRDAHSLHYNFNIGRNRQAQCKVQGELDGKNFLSYDCGNDNVTSMNHPREEDNATDLWKAQIAILKCVRDLLNKELPGIEPEQNTDSEPLPLQVRMMCQQDAGGHTNGSWEFGFNGQSMATFDPESMEYTVVYPGGERITKKLESNQPLTKAFHAISLIYCIRWLKDFSSWMTRAPANTAPATVQSKATTITSIIWTLPVVLTCWIIAGITV